MLPTKLYRLAVALLAVVLLAGAIAAPAPAHAQSAASDAASLNEEGFERFAEGEFAEAARLFRRAHDRLPRAEFRKNEAVAWFKAEQCEEAVAAAQSYLRTEGTPDDQKSQARSIIANCKVRLAREALDAGSVKLAVTLLQEAEALEPDDFTRDQISAVWIEIARNQRTAQQQDSPGDRLGPEEARRAERAEAAARTDGDQSGAKQAEFDLSPTEGQAITTTPPREEGGPAILGWALVGMGVATIVANVIYHVFTLEAEDELISISENGGERSRYDQLEGRIDTARWLVPTLYGVGGALTGAGLWFVIDPGSDSPDGSAGNGAVGIQFHTRF